MKCSQDLFVIVLSSLQRELTEHQKLLSGTNRESVDIEFRESRIAAVENAIQLLNGDKFSQFCDTLGVKNDA